MKVLDILLSSRGVDGRGGLPPRQSSLVLLGLLWNPPVDYLEGLQIKYPREGLY